MTVRKISKFDFAYSFLLKLIISTFLVAIINGNEQCEILICPSKVSHQLAVDISMSHYSSANEGSCVSKFTRIEVNDLYGVYCPEEFFCGIDLVPQRRGEKGLKFNESADCQLFAKSEEGCAKLEQDLAVNGKYAVCNSKIRNVD